MPFVHHLGVVRLDCRWGFQDTGSGLFKEAFVKRSAWFKIAGAVMILGLAQLACSIDLGTGGASQEQPAGGDPNREDASGGQVPAEQATATHIPYSGPTGGVTGRLLWNGQPVTDVQVKLCEDIQFLGGCIGQQYTSTTDASGVYTFSEVIPMSYALVYHALDTDTWVYVSTGFLSAQDFEVVPDEVADFGDFNIVRYDVRLVGPVEDSQQSEARPTLGWEAYPDAAYYEIYLTQSPGMAIFVSDQVNQTSIVPGVDLLSCEYTWSIEVYNSAGIEIAETDGYWHFEVTGQPYTCHVTGLFPADAATVNGQGIVLSWDDHGLAAYYKIQLVNADDGTVILDNVRVDGNSYTIPQTLPPGAYDWYVAAYNQSDDYFALSGTYSLVVP